MIFLVARIPHKAVSKKFGDIKERPERPESPLPVIYLGVSAIFEIGLSLRGKLRILEKLFGFLGLKPSERLVRW